MKAAIETLVERLLAFTTLAIFVGDSDNIFVESAIYYIEEAIKCALSLCHTGVKKLSSSSFKYGVLTCHHEDKEAYMLLPIMGNTLVLPTQKSGLMITAPFTPLTIQDARIGYFTPSFATGDFLRQLKDIKKQAANSPSVARQTMLISLLESSLHENHSLNPLDNIQDNFCFARNLTAFGYPELAISVMQNAHHTLEQYRWKAAPPKQVPVITYIQQEIMHIIQDIRRKCQ